MKSINAVFIAVCILVALLCACASGTSNYEEGRVLCDAEENAATNGTPAVAENDKPDEVKQYTEPKNTSEQEIKQNPPAKEASKQEGRAVYEGFPPELSYNSLEEALSDIKAVKEAGPEVEHNYNYDYANIYEQDHFCVLKEVPYQLNCKLELGIVIGPHGISMCYNIEDGYSADVTFSWVWGLDKEESIVRYSHYLEGFEYYQDADVYLAKNQRSIRIFWWENDDEFMLEYPTETEIPPEELINCLEVVRYDF